MTDKRKFLEARIKNTETLKKAIKIIEKTENVKIEAILCESEANLALFDRRAGLDAIFVGTKELVGINVRVFNEAGEPHFTIRSERKGGERLEYSEDKRYETEEERLRNDSYSFKQVQYIHIGVEEELIKWICIVNSEELRNKLIKNEIKKEENYDSFYYYIRAMEVPNCKIIKLDETAIFWRYKKELTTI